MRTFLLALLASAAAHAGDEQKVALEATAQVSFDRVQAPVAIDFAATVKCLQAQAMLLAVATPEESASIVFRKAFCTLAGAELTGDRAALASASEEFGNAIADRQSPAAKQRIALPVPSTWRILDAVAHLKTGAPADSLEQPLITAVNTADCQSNAGALNGGGTAEFCRSVHQLGSAWLGWIASNRGDLPAAARNFADSGAPGWNDWIDGRRAFQAIDYPAAASSYGRAVESWRNAHLALVIERLRPQPDFPASLTEYGAAKLAAGDASGAIRTLDEVVKADAANARALYLRAVAKDRVGQGPSALEDYNLASRAAFARTGDAAGEEAHLYRGILLYRRKEFQRAEEEFSTAVNAGGAEPWRADARSWRYLAAVAGGACGTSRDLLQRSLANASPYFPKQEAQTVSSACPVTSASVAVH